MILRVDHTEEQNPDQQNTVLKIPAVMQTATQLYGVSTDPSC